MPDCSLPVRKPRCFPSRNAALPRPAFAPCFLFPRGRGRARDPPLAAGRAGLRWGSWSGAQGGERAAVGSGLRDAGGRHPSAVVAEQGSWAGPLLSGPGARALQVPWARLALRSPHIRPDTGERQQGLRMGFGHSDTLGHSPARAGSCHTGREGPSEARALCVSNRGSDAG